MELIPENMVSIHLIDENFLFMDDIFGRYSDKKKYEVKYYPSVDKFISENEKRSLSRKGIHIVILAVQLNRTEMDLSTDLSGQLNTLFPLIEIIKICHEKEVEGEYSSLRNGNVLRVVNNENALLRIDNAVKLVLAKNNLENKNRIYKQVLVLLLISLFSSALFILFSKIS
jgi:hypothetical protein